MINRRASRVALFFGLFALLIIGLTEFGAHTRAQKKDKSKLPTAYVPGRVLVKFRDRTSAERVNDLLGLHGAQSERTLPQIGVHVVALPESADENALAQSFRVRPEVEFAELDRIVPPEEMTPNDPMYGDEWHLTKISAPAAWSITTGSSNVIVAILDTGVDATHEDLAQKMVSGWNTYSNNSDTSDVYGHGTKVAGTAASSSNNSMGVAAVAWGCKIMPIRISDASGNATYSAMASGLNWAAEHGARVANISYIASESSTVRSAAQYFQSKGGVVTSSAGNYTTFSSAPDNPYILTVSATDPTDVLSYWSNTGNNIDLAAPEGADTTRNGGGYTYAGGTSIAAPIVAGVAALVMSANPSLTPTQVQDILKQSADDLGAQGWDTSYGGGRVNAAGAVSMAVGGSAADTTPPTVSMPAPVSGATVAGSVTVQVAAGDNVGVTVVRLSVDGAALGADSTSPYTVQWDTTTAGNGPHTLTATASDAAGNSASTSTTVTVSNNGPAPDITSPVVTITSPPEGGRVSGNVSVPVSASDNVGVVKSELYVDGVQTAASTAAPFTTRWNARKAKAGAHKLQCKAYDAAGNVGLSQIVTVYR